MTRISKLHAQALAGSAISFKELQRLAEAFGFELKRISGSHHIYRHPQARRLLNIQPAGKQAKAYQVREFLDMVEALGLQSDEE